MHNRATSYKIIKKHREIISDNSLSKVKFPNISTSRVMKESKKIYTSQLTIRQKSVKSVSPIKNFDFLLNRCEKELKKIRKISTKLKKSTRKLKHHQGLINEMICKPLYSIKVLSKDKPKFLTKHMKYE